MEPSLGKKKKGKGKGKKEEGEKIFKKKNDLPPPQKNVMCSAIFNFFFSQHKKLCTTWEIYIQKIMIWKGSHHLFYYGGKPRQQQQQQETFSYEHLPKK